MSTAGEGRPSLGYLLPTYQTRSGEHFAHVPKLLEQLGREVELEVVIWDCQDEPELPGVARVTRLASTSALARYRELKRLIHGRVAAGVRRWFVRSAPLPALAVQAGGAECIFWVCGVHRPPRTLRDKLDHALFRRACERVTQVATAPGMEAYNETELGIPKEKTLLLNNDLDLSRWRPLTDEQRVEVRARLDWPTARPVLLYVHRLTTLRGAGALIPTVERCYAAGHEPLVVAVGGSGDLSDELAAYAAAHPTRLRLEGPRPNHELPAYYGAADLFLMPSYGEGFPRVVLESMATGTPMIATDVGVTKRILPAELVDALVVPPRDHERFAERAVALLDDPTFGQQVRDRFLEQVVEFGVERVAAEYRKVLVGD